MSIKKIQKQSLKDKIKSLMNRNKQLDTQLKQTSSGQQKEQIEQEKSANTNELRKSRTQKYELEQVKEDIDYIKRAYLHLRKIGIIKSQYEYSNQFLNRTNHYFSMILSEQRQPSIDSINTLVQNLIALKNIYEDYDNKNTHIRLLESLIKTGKQIITQRLLRYL